MLALGFSGYHAAEAEGLRGAQPAARVLGLTLFDVEELPTHGGSLRIYGRHSGNARLEVTGRVLELRRRETDDGFLSLQRYRGFEERVKATKRKLLAFLIE